jgi:hypothetical protein
VVTKVTVRIKKTDHEGSGDSALGMAKDGVWNAEIR